MAQLVVPADEPAALQAVRRQDLGRPRRRWAGALPGVARLAVLLVATATLGAPAVTRAEEPELLLFLGIQRSTTIDKLASQIIIEHLQERGENLLKAPNLSDTDRRCRRLQCLAPLALQRKAALVLDGDVQQVGANRSLRVVMHLYDSRKRQQHELENLCVDCDETKLGIVLTNTTTDLLGQYRKTAVAMDQLAALLDAPPVAAQDQAVRPAGTVASTIPTAPTNGASPQSAVAQAQVQAQTQVGANPDQAVAAAPAPAQYPTLPGDTGLPASGPAAYPTPMPPLPVAEVPPPSRPIKHGLSNKRKAVAAVFGTIGVGTLVASIVMTVLDHRLASNNTYNPNGSPCVDPQYAGQSCVLSTVRLWAPGYGVGALFLGGMILTLTIPERDRH